MNERKHILVLAYMLSPYKGSEFSVAWNYVTEMSKDNDLTVLYGISGKHMGDCEEMETFIKDNPIPGVNLIAVKPNGLANALNYLNRHDIFVYTFYYAYRVWQWLAYKKAMELMKYYDFDLIHYVGMIGYREPGYLWKLGLPYVWGPVSGANNAPLQLMKRMPFSGKMKQLFRNFANTLQFKYSSRLKKALKSTDILLTATSENHDKFLDVHGKDSICIPENAIIGNISLNQAKFIAPDKYRLIVVGTLDARKSVGILLEAVSLMKYKNKILLDIVGDGPLRGILESQAKNLGINDIINWHGLLPRTKAVELFDSAHLHVITSVSEGNPTTIWEAMMHGVPTLSFDHCGMHDSLRDGAGILIPIKNTYEENIEVIVSMLDHMIENPEKFKVLAFNTLSRAKLNTWLLRRQFLNNLYTALLSDKKYEYNKKNI
ncbi:glycosyltransferase [Tannerella sp. AF04-6]|nr:glycosyltransferase [Tannerella sp. AF04-6]